MKETVEQRDEREARQHVQIPAPDTERKVAGKGSVMRRVRDFDSCTFEGAL